MADPRPTRRLRYRDHVSTDNTSEALFGQIDWALPTASASARHPVQLRQEECRLQPRVYGGLQTTDPALLALKRTGLYAASVQGRCRRHQHVGPAHVPVQGEPEVDAYATYATAFKPVGMNVGGLPTDANNNPILASAVVRPEDVRHSSSA